MYSDLVAVLIEGIKEMSQSLHEQNNKILELENLLISNGQNLTNTDVLSSVNDILLYQNIPNPFNKDTEIAYRIPKNVKAFIGVYNLNGLQLKKYPLMNNATQGKIVISSSELNPGIYLYSLIINGKEIDSKKMVLTD